MYKFQNESLGRQLDLLTNELEDLRASELLLIKERKKLQADNQKCSQIIAKQKHVVDQMKANEIELVEKARSDRKNYEVRLYYYHLSKKII